MQRGAAFREATQTPCASLFTEGSAAVCARHRNTALRVTTPRNAALSAAPQRKRLRFSRKGGAQQSAATPRRATLRAATPDNAARRTATHRNEASPSFNSGAKHFYFQIP